MGRMFAHSHTFNCIPKQDGSWGHTPPTENTLCKISSLTLRHSAMSVIVKSRWSVSAVVKSKWSVSVAVKSRWSVSVAVKSRWSVSVVVKSRWSVSVAVKSRWSVSVAVKSRWSVSIAAYLVSAKMVTLTQWVWRHTEEQISGSGWK